MKFAPREGSAARTLAVTARAAQPSARRLAAGWNRADGSSPQVPVRSGATTTTTTKPAVAPNTLRVARGQAVFHAGQGAGLVYIVRDGCIRLYKVLPDGRSINLALLGPNTVFTQEDMSNGIAKGANAEALVDSTIAVVETASLAALIAESPSLAAAIVNGATRRLTEMQTLVEQLLVRDTAVRLATTLLNIASYFGRPTADKMIAITIPLTHQSLASMIGSNRVTVTRKLLQLQELGAVRTLGRNTLAISSERLLAYVQEAGERDFD